MVIFDASGMSADGVRIWHAARRLGESANARARSSARLRFGGRTSSIGWIGWVLLLAALTGGLAFAVALQAEDAVLTAAFSAATAMAVLVAAAGARGRPLDRALWRPQAVALVGTAVAVVLVGGGATAPAMTVLVGAPIIVGTSLVAGMIIRGAKAQQAREVDDSLTAAYRAVIADLPAHVERLEPRRALRCRRSEHDSSNAPAPPSSNGCGPTSACANGLVGDWHGTVTRTAQGASSSRISPIRSPGCRRRSRGRRTPRTIRGIPTTGTADRSRRPVSASSSAPPRRRASRAGRRATTRRSRCPSRRARRRARLARRPTRSGRGRGAHGRARG